MKNTRTFVTTALLSAVLALTGSVAHAQDAQTCQPGLVPAVEANPVAYSTLVNALVPSLGTLGQ